MDIIGYYNKGYALGRYLLLSILVLNLFSLAAASTPADFPDICTGLQDLCTTSQTFLAAVMMIMIVMAGATYAIGQILGAETRARASVWATAMLTGAIIGALIYMITPYIIARMLPEAADINIDPTNPCSFCG